VGVIGFGEQVVAEVTRPLVDAAGLIARLAPVAPDGIRFTSARSLDAGRARRVGRGPSRILWMLPVATSRGVGEALDDILARETIPRRRVSGKREVTVDLRPLVATARLGSVDEADDLREAGLAPDSGVVLVEALPVDGRWIRPSELLSLLSERGVRASWVARRIFAGGEEP
jgi:hypothetical protein